jgi:hypothetical protein
LIIRVFKLEINEDWEKMTRIEQCLGHLKDKEYLICNWFDLMEDSLETDTKIKFIIWRISTAKCFEKK